MILILNSILPTFGLILLGILLKRKWFSSEEFWKNSEKLSYFILFPALIIKSLSQTNFKELDVSGLVYALIIATLLVSVVLIILQKYLKLENKFFTSVFQGGIRYSSYIFMSMTEILYGSEGTALMAIIMAYMLILTNVLSVLVINFYVPQEKSSNIIGLIKQFLTNPLILACLIGIAFSMLSIDFGKGFTKFLSYLGQGALPLSLLCVGASLKFNIQTEKWIWIFLTSIIKLIVFPLLVALLLKIFKVAGMAWEVGILYASVPVPGNAYILARQMGADHESMASIVTTTTLMAIVTMTIMLAMF
jgi:predicted permease